MARRIYIPAICLTLLMAGCLIAWISGELVGKPATMLSDERGTERSFAVNESEMNRAVTNAFDLLRHNRMMLIPATDVRSLTPSRQPTNGYFLIPTGDPTARVRTTGVLGERQLPYEAFFYVGVSAVGTNKSKAVVTTVLARVFDGITLNHNGTGRRPVKFPPIKQEEEKILEEISKSIKELGP